MFKVQGKGEKTGATETVIPAMLRGYTGLLPTIILTCWRVHYSMLIFANEHWTQSTADAFTKNRASTEKWPNDGTLDKKIFSPVAVKMFDLKP